MLYFVCTHCDDKFVMDERYVEIADDQLGAGATKQVGLDYEGRDCLCPVCGNFTGRLVELTR